LVPGGEEEDESAGARAAGAERGAAAEAAAGDGGHRLADEQQRQRGGAQPGRRVGAVHAVGPLLPRVRLHPRRWAALLGGDGEAEGDDVDDQDDGQHPGGVGHDGGAPRNPKPAAAAGDLRSPRRRLALAAGSNELAAVSYCTACRF
jgi:hypothetical protein